MESAADTEIFQVAAFDADIRIDKLLAERYRDLNSRHYFQRLIREGHVTVNGAQVKKKDRVAQGDEIEIHFILAPEIHVEPEDIPLEILYEDADIIVLNKASGMVVHPAPGNWTGTLVNAVLYHCRLQDGWDDTMRPGIVHRLDKETSGAIVVAKTLRAHRMLGESFAGRHVKKEYLAVCVGNPGEGTVDAPIGRHPIHRKMMATDVDRARDALTHYNTEAHQGDIALVRLELHTGRTHQARVHMRHLGCPVLGDSVYGAAKANKRYSAKRQLLHAEILEIPHPSSGERLKFQAPIPPDMLAWIERLQST